MEEIDGYPALRFTRRLAHPVERVWRAVTSYEDLAAWFVAPAEFRGQGQRFEAMGQSGEVLRFEAPRIVEWEWGGERFSFELEPDGEATLLTFRHVFKRRERAADHGAGWHFHLDRLDAHLAGEPVPEAEPADLAALNDRYSERFGLDPKVGREILAEHFGADALR
jgi:uncharacterized protein YndB with AHSA1/START domain